MLSLILDVVVLVGLGVTIYYCIRLSKNLNAFREYRAEFTLMLQDLTKSINKAQASIENLKKSSQSAKEELSGIILEGDKLKEELQLMTAAGDSMASRLEKLAEKNRKIARNIETHSYDGDDDSTHASDEERRAAQPKPFQPPVKDKPQAAKGKNGLGNGKGQSQKKQAQDFPSFFIQDRDFEEGEEANTDPADMDFDTEGGEFQSRAERELYEALKGGNKG